MWDESVNASYASDIFGIGRDDAAGLDQRVSMSVNTGAILTVATDNDFVSANTDTTSRSTQLSDLQFLTFSNNGGAHSGALYTTDGTNNIIVNATDEIFAGTLRTWLVQDTGGVGTVNLQFENFPAVPAGGQYLLAVDPDGDFSDGNWVATTVGTFNGGNITFAHDFADNTNTYIKVIATPEFSMELGSATSSQVEGNGTTHTVNIPVNIAFTLGNDVNVVFDTAD